MSRRTVIATLIAAALIAVGCAASPGVEEPAPVVVETSTPPTAENTSAVPSVDTGSDVGSGKPGAFCATSRFGKRFVKDGITYVCKGPKPYKWRRADG